MSRDMNRKRNSLKRFPRSRGDEPDANSYALNRV